MVKQAWKTLLIGSLLLGSSLVHTGTPAGAEAAIDAIPNTTRIEKSYDQSFLSITGFASLGVKDRSEYVGTSYHRTVNTARELLQALLDARSGNVKVIEITADLDLGWKALALTPEEMQTYNFISEYSRPSNGFTNPLLEASGVSQLKIANVDGLTIFSTNGHTIKHAELNLQNSSNDIVLRNLSFDGMWQWDDSGAHKEVGWTFIKVNGATNVWIDHCSFTIAADGMIDLENGATNVTLSWNTFGLLADEQPDPNGNIYQSIEFMEQKYQEGSLGENSLYARMRNGGATKNQIMAYAAYHSKVHLNGSGDKDYTDYVRSNGEVVKDGNHRIKMTMAYNHYTNVGQRLPMIRQGTGHLFNNVFDNSTHQQILDSVPAISQQGTDRLSRGINSRNGASIAGDTNVYIAFNEPIIGAERQGDDTKNMNAPWDVLFQNAINHFLLVNSKLTTPSGETYIGSSWDNNGDNPFTKGVTWYDKSTIGKWAWSSSIVGVENMHKDKPPAEPFEFTYHYDEQLPYTYQIVPLSEVETTINQYAGAGKLQLSAEEWLKISYEAEAASEEDAEEGGSKSLYLVLAVAGGVVVLAALGWFLAKRKK